jgi:hypothetical protein
MNANNDADANANYDAGRVSDLAEWGSKWGQMGAEIGERYARAFSAPDARPAPTARPAPAVRSEARNFDFSGFSNFNPGNKYSDRELDAMVGVTDDYRKEIADAGFPNASRKELLQARSLGLRGDYISDMRKAGINVPLATYGQAHARGVSSDYIESLRDAGLSGSLSDYIKARDMGVNAGYVQVLRMAGINGTIDDYARARTVGLSAGYVSGLAGLGVSGSIEDYQQMRAVGITSGYVAALHKNGTMITDPRRLIEIKTKGWRAKDRSDDP